MKLSHEDMETITNEIFNDNNYLYSTKEIEILKQKKENLDKKIRFSSYIFIFSVLSLPLGYACYNYFDIYFLLSISFYSFMGSGFFLALLGGKDNKLKTQLHRAKSSFDKKKPYDRIVSFKALKILHKHYDTFFITDKYNNKRKNKITYYDILDANLFEQIFGFSKTEKGKDDETFYQLLAQLEKDKNLQS